MKVLYILLLIKLLLCTYVQGYGAGGKGKPSDQNTHLKTTKARDCSQINDLLEKLVGDNGILLSLTRAIMIDGKSGSQMTKGDILGIGLGVDLIQGLLGINVGVDLDSKLFNGILDVNGLLQSLLENNGTVNLLLKGLLQNRDDTQLSYQKDSGTKQSNSNMLLELLRRLGLSNLLSGQSSGSLLGNTVDTLLGNNLIADGLLKGLLTGDLLEGLLGDESLLGCLLNRLLKGLLGDSSLLSRLLKDSTSTSSERGYQTGSSYQRPSNQNNNRKLNAIEKLLLLEILNKMKSQGVSKGKQSQNAQPITTKVSDCSQINDLLEKLVGDNGILLSLTRAIMIDNKSGSQMTKGDILGIGLGVDLIQGLLGINLGVDLDSKLVNGILDVNGLLQSLLGNNGAVDLLLQGLLQNRDDTQLSNQRDSGTERSNSNILVELLWSLGLSGQNQGSLLGNTVDKLLGNNLIADGLLKGLLTGDLLEALLGDESLLGCLLNRLLGGLLGDSSLLSKLLGGNSSSERGYERSDYQRLLNQNTNRKLNAVEKILLLEMLTKMKSQKSQEGITQKQTSGGGDNINNYSNNYSGGVTNENGNNGRGTFSYNEEKTTKSEDCTKENVLLEKVLGLLENLLRVTIINDNTNGQVTKNDILGLNLGINIIRDVLGVNVGLNLNSNLLDGILGVNGLLQSLLGGNGTVDFLLRSLLQNKNNQPDQGGSPSSTDNILLGLLTRLGLLNAQTVRNQGLVGNLVDTLLGNTFTRDGLLRGLLNGNLLEGILGDRSLLGCLLNRLLGGLLGENGLLGGLLGDNSSLGTGKQGYQENQNNNNQMKTAEKLLLIQILQKILAQNQNGGGSIQRLFTPENNNGASGQETYYGHSLMQHQGEVTSQVKQDGSLSSMEKLFLLSLLKRLLTQNLECNYVQVPRYMTANSDNDKISRYINEISNGI